jgi:hypothetical protein
MVHDFDRHAPPGLTLLSLVHCAHAALAEQAKDAVIAEVLSDDGPGFDW